MKLVIISHTPHYRLNKTIVGWSPTVREINYLTEIADEVVHVAPLSSAPAPAFGEAYYPRVRFVAMPVVGGAGLLNKLSIVWRLPQIVATVLRELRGADFFQFRAPTGIGVYLIPLLLLLPRRGWFKFAGNWNAGEYPLSYRMQRWMLTRWTKKVVTVNGVWPGQPAHVITFDNPCLTAAEITQGHQAAMKKNFEGNLTMLFVGRLSAAKGMDLIVSIMEKLRNRASISKIVFVGDGSPEPYQQQLSPLVPVVFAGNLKREEINRYYEAADIFILPSYSEGFPKVLAESGAFGCVPAISNVSSIGQYINASNGLLFDTFDPAKMAVQLDRLLEDRPGLKHRSSAITTMANRFSYAVYNDRIKTEIFNRS